MNANDPYLAYYRRQQLQTGAGIDKVFRGAPYQRGHGVGSFLGGMFRTITPLLKSGAATVAKEALKSGVGFLGDIATRDPKEAAEDRFKQFTESLKRKADGKLERVLRGGGGGGCSGGPCAKRKRVTRKSNAKRKRVRVTRKSNAKRAMSGGRRRVTPQSLAKLLRGRTSSKRGKKRTTRKKAAKRTSVRDIFN